MYYYCYGRGGGKKKKKKQVVEDKMLTHLRPYRNLSVLGRLK